MSARAAYPFRERREVIGQSGMCMLDLRFIVEQAHYERGGVRWLRQGELHGVHELANQAADKLRAQGFRVRVRPVVI